MNLGKTLKTFTAQLLMSQVGLRWQAEQEVKARCSAAAVTIPQLSTTAPRLQEHRLSITCTACPNGTVSKQPALTCSLCLPG